MTRINDLIRILETSVFQAEILVDKTIFNFNLLKELIKKATAFVVFRRTCVLR